MSTISWNCRGLGNPWTVQELLDLVFTKKPKFVFLMELKVSRDYVDRIKIKMYFEGLFYVQNAGFSGGIALLWKENHVGQLISYSTNYIDISVKIVGMLDWRLTCFYGFPERGRRIQAWHLLRQLKDKSQQPWCVIGDFNDLMSQSEKRGRLPHPSSLIQGFNEAVNDCGLHDLGFHGYEFTWDKSRGTENWVEERLDRALADLNWCAMFEYVKPYNLDTYTSDHSALFLDFGLNVKAYSQRQFRFENDWIKEA